jgi:hypothetical protein
MQESNLPANLANWFTKYVCLTHWGAGATSKLKIQRTGMNKNMREAISLHLARYRFLYQLIAAQVRKAISSFFHMLYR